MHEVVSSYLADMPERQKLHVGVPGKVMSAYAPHADKMRIIFIENTCSKVCLAPSACGAHKYHMKNYFYRRKNLFVSFFHQHFPRFHIHVNKLASHRSRACPNIFSSDLWRKLIVCCLVASQIREIRAFRGCGGVRVSCLANDEIYCCGGKQYVFRLENSDCTI